MLNARWDWRETVAGFAKLIDQQKMRMNSQGGGVAYQPAADGITFYATAHDTIFSDKNRYWLQPGRGLHIQQFPGSAPSPTSGGCFAHTVSVEQNNFAATALFTDPQGDFWVWDFSMGGLAGMVLGEGIDE